ncbi:MAG TPA: hypothetical protein VLL72_11120, partial [Kiloniellales bacterium]|nr:hypothetical protein [Kiloniellales bacterium]
PMIESGGFRGESKASYLRQIDKSQGHWVAPWTVIDVPPGAQVLRLAAEAETAAGAAGIAYPIVVKPDIGASGYGVRLVHDTHELVDYLAAYPPGQKLMLQAFVPWSGEAGIFYVRQPGDACGRIYSLGLRYHPFVVGDGRSPLRELILADPRLSRRAKLYFANFEPRLSEVPATGEPVRLATVASLRVGSLYRDGAAHVTDVLTKRLDGIARTMPEFYYGRFDVRFCTIEGLERGEDFRIIEINGAGAEAIHVWDPDLSIGMAYRTWFDQHEILFAIGARNRERGFRPMTLRQIIAMQWKESRLLRSYPESN